LAIEKIQWKQRPFEGGFAMKVKKRMSRRQFLSLAGVSLGAGMLACCGFGALELGGGSPKTALPVGFPDETFGEKVMTTKILVAYASQAGSTGGVAETIGTTLAEGGAAVDVRPVQAVKDLDGYQAVVLGSAIHSGKWLPEAVDFLQGHQAELRRMPTAFFLVCMLAATSSKSNQNFVAQFLADQRALVKPVAEGRFAGALLFDKHSPGEAFGLRIFSLYCGLGLRGGDYRDPEAIRAWTQNVRPLLVQ
jgi:menaquinone-dependent protoporphyrinogen oxidase